MGKVKIIGHSLFCTCFYAHGKVLQAVPGRGSHPGLFSMGLAIMSRRTSARQFAWVGPGVGRNSCNHDWGVNRTQSTLPSHLDHGVDRTPFLRGGLEGGRPAPPAGLITWQMIACAVS